MRASAMFQLILEQFQKRLEERGHIYLGKYSGWYCVSDEAFLSDTEIVEQKDATGKVIRVSTESGNTVEWTEEENYKFRLSAFQDDLKYWLKNGILNFNLIFLFKKFFLFFYLTSTVLHARLKYIRHRRVVPMVIDF